MRSEEKNDYSAGSRARFSNRARDEIQRYRESFKQQGLTPATIRAFQSVILSFFKKYGRDLPWRNTTDPYRIFVSEIMLQQTQVDRVIDKYQVFLDRFPNVAALADATLQEVLNAWLGLGYNRRAMALKRSAEKIVKESEGTVPNLESELIRLPGVGKYTAAAIAVFAFNRPLVLVETNVRTVFIHFFFHDRRSVSDQELIPLVDETLDRSNPRQWYNALMDYGGMLKKEFPNPNRRSAHYTKQSRFEGSDRQIRGTILRILGNGKAKGEGEIVAEFEEKDVDRVKRILEQLKGEGFLKRRNKEFLLR